MLIVHTLNFRSSSSSYLVFTFNHKITRNIRVMLSDGLNRIEVRNLANSIDSDSVMVEGIGNAVVLDVIYSEYPGVK